MQTYAGIEPTLLPNSNSVNSALPKNTGLIEKKLWFVYALVDLFISQYGALKITLEIPQS